jgi:hypothetical protein
LAGGDEALAELSGRLAAIAEELDDLAFDRLRAAARSDDADERAGASAEERRLTQARRAVDKAARLLGPRTDDA